jgi:hypothetical protein
MAPIRVKVAGIASLFASVAKGLKELFYETNLMRHRQILHFWTRETD